jgi:hypothetical protein
MSTVAELIEKLQEVPSHWRVRATKAGNSLEVWDPEGAEYAYVFTDERATRKLIDRWRRRQQRKENDE